MCDVDLLRNQPASNQICRFDSKEHIEQVQFAVNALTHAVVRKLLELPLALRLQQQVIAARIKQLFDLLHG